MSVVTVAFLGMGRKVKAYFEVCVGCYELRKRLLSSVVVTHGHGLVGMLKFVMNEMDIALPSSGTSCHGLWPPIWAWASWNAEICDE
jgi:hypothetical protein